MKSLLLGLSLLFVLSPLAAFASPAVDDYQAGVQYYQQKQYEQAIASLKDAVSVNPQSWQAYQLLGSSYYQKGDLAAALNNFQTSLKLHPDNPALRKFVDRFNQAPTPSTPALPALSSDSVPLASTGMNVKPMGDPAPKSGHIFYNVTAAYEIPFGGPLAAARAAYNSQAPASSGGYGNSNYYESEIFGGGTELGFEFDKENGISVNLYGSITTSGPDMEIYSSSGTTGTYSYSDCGISGGITQFGLRYYRYLPEGADRFFGFLGADYYSLGISYNVSQQTGAFPSDSGGSTYGDLSGSAIGGSIGIGRQMLLFGFLNFEASVAFKYANVTQVTGLYTSTTFVNAINNAQVTGQGTLVTLSNGSVVLVDQKNVGSAKITSFDLSGVEGRAAFNIWF